MGTSIAFHLAQAGVRDIVLLERDTLGSGSSAKPLGGVRATFSDPGQHPARPAQPRGLRALRPRVPHGHRAAPGRATCSCAGPQAEADAVAESAELQNRMGGDTRLLDPAQAAALNPYLDPRALVSASFSPRDGYARPARVVAGYRAAAEAARGRASCEHTEVLGIEPGDGRAARHPHEPRHARDGHAGHRRRRVVRGVSVRWWACTCRSSRFDGSSA